MKRMINNTKIFSVTKNTEMKIIHFEKYRKFRNPKMSYIFEKTLVLSVICIKCKNEEKKMFKEEKSTEKLKIVGLIKNT